MNKIERERMQKELELLAKHKCKKVEKHQYTIYDFIATFNQLYEMGLVRFINRDFKKCKIKSFNCDTALRNCLKYCFINYNIPSVLFDDLFHLSFAVHYNKRSCYSENIATFVEKWIYPITSGMSFYQFSKNIFSKKEAGYFTSIKFPKEIDNTFKAIFYTKAICKSINKVDALVLANNLYDKLNHIKKANINSFLIYRKFIDSFIEFISKHNINKNSIVDILDYFFHNLEEIKSFNFKNRNENSVMKIVISWHEKINAEARQERKAFNDFRRYRKNSEKIVDTTYVKNTSIKYPIWIYYDRQEKTSFKCSQILSYQDLIDEGRTMHNCVSSYHGVCLTNKTQIFSMLCNEENYMTIEYRPRDRTIVQARLRYNRSLTEYAKKILNKFATDNGLKVHKVI